MRPDDGASYAETATIDLSKVQSFVAKYPRPDDVVPVSDVQGQRLDGCFIGACTTAEEDIIMGALILEQGLKAGKVPVPNGKRKVVPGSRPIIDRLEKSGLADIYRKAGFEVGVPGCSYCVGMSADQAGPGEVWLSSQNRNFENRMGKGECLLSSYYCERFNNEYRFHRKPSIRCDSSRIIIQNGHHKPSGSIRCHRPSKIRCAQRTGFVADNINDAAGLCRASFCRSFA